MRKFSLLLLLGLFLDTTPRVGQDKCSQHLGDDSPKEPPEPTTVDFAFLKVKVRNIENTENDGTSNSNISSLGKRKCSTNGT